MYHDDGLNEQADQHEGCSQEGDVRIEQTGLQKAPEEWQEVFKEHWRSERRCSRSTG